MNSAVGMLGDKGATTDDQGDEDRESSLGFIPGLESQPRIPTRLRFPMLAVGRFGEPRFDAAPFPLCSHYAPPGTASVGHRMGPNRRIFNPDGASSDAC